MNTRSVELAGRQLSVVDGRVEGWDFWSAFASGNWEPETLDEIENLQPGQLLFDIGAWWGPVSLWAAHQGVRVIAVEPDPLAYQQLFSNILLNGYEHLIQPLPMAITPTAGPVSLLIDGEGGTSASSLTRVGDNRINVMGTTLHSMIEVFGKPDLIKMDIEGGECIVLPVAGPELRALNIPLLLSLHPHWFNPEAVEVLAEELSQWESRNMINQTGFYIPRHD